MLTEARQAKAAKILKNLFAGFSAASKTALAVRGIMC